MTDSKAWWAKCENIIREGCVPVGETWWERVFLARDYDAVVKERDDLRLACDEKERIGDAFLVRAEKAEYQIKVLRDLADIDTEARDKITAERDKLAATVERVRAVRTCRGNIFGSSHDVVVRCELDRALAEPEPRSCDLCHAEPHNYATTIHGYGKCIDRRKGQRRRGYEHTYQSDSKYYGTQQVRYCINGNSGPDKRRKERREPAVVNTSDDRWYCSRYRTTDEPMGNHGWGKCRA